MKKNNTWKYLIATTFIIIVTVFILLVMGRNFICTCETIKLWYSGAVAAEGSQHLTDFYTFSHIIHGFAFFALLSLSAKKLSFGMRSIIAVILEAVWEIIENTPAIINHYRQSTVSFDYNGDSILNSLMDIMAMILGFWLASRLPVRVSIALIIIMEVVVGYLIRDNLTLNILMLLYPSDTIRLWQMGG